MAQLHAYVNRIALNLAKLEAGKGSLRGKLKRAGWDDTFSPDYSPRSPSP